MQNETRTQLIIACITGPTGIGKSQLVLELAEKFSAEIIGADSRQIYKGVSIGVASPSTIDLERIPHHLIGFLPLTESYSVGKFYKALHSFSQSEQPYIVAGGTGFYIKAMQQGLQEIPDVSQDIRAEVKATLEAKGIEEFRNLACQIDPEAASKIKPLDSHRLSRIIEIHQETGRTWTSYLNQTLKPLFPNQIYQLDRPRDELYRRINQRVDDMIQDGWVEEVRYLLEHGHDFTEPGLDALGYREIAKELQLNNHKSISNRLQEYISRKTRNYAKRQITFLRTQFNKKTIIDMNNPSILKDLEENIKKENFF